MHNKKERQEMKLHNFQVDNHDVPNVNIDL